MFDIVDLPDSRTLVKLSKRFPALEIPALETWLTLMRISCNCLNDLDQFLVRHNLSQRKFFVLILLMRNPDGLKVSQLADGTGVSCATMTGVVDGLLNAKLVTRETDEQDRRAFVVTITSAGQELLDQVLPRHYWRVSRIMSMLDDAERTQLNGLLSKIGAGLDKARKESVDSTIKNGENG